MEYPRVASFKTIETLRNYAASLGLELGIEETIERAPGSPLAQPLDLDGFRAGNRFMIQPMEGWDGLEDGNPSELTIERWRNFGRSGAKWIWGGEAMAVLPEARANPRQVMIGEHTRRGLAALKEALEEAHRQAVGNTADLFIGFQLTHSGRFSKPSPDRLEPKILYHHPLLDPKFGIPPDYPILTDDEIARIVDKFIEAAGIAEDLGAHFVDIKHCHGYLGHEFLSAHTRSGRYGGPFENRTRFLREVVEGIRASTRRLRIGVRFSAFDFVSFHPDPARGSPGKLGPGIPDDFSGCLPYRYGFGVRPDQPTAPDLTEAFEFMELLRALNIKLVNITAGSPYYNPHIQRPALFPPSDGYQPPEDPLVSCWRQVEATARIKARFPDMVVGGTAYTYFQEFLPNVAQHVVRQGMVDAIGLGRMVLAYPELPRDVLEHGRVNTRRLCRTFSDCTTAPRNGLVSGCYPLDPNYRAMPEAAKLKQIKLRMGKTAG